MSATVIPGTPAAVVSPPLDWQASVPTAFALGWQISDLFAMSAALARDPRNIAQHTRDGAEHSPGHNSRPALAAIAAWSPADRWDLAVHQIASKSNRLKAAFQHFGSETDDLDQFEATAHQLLGQAGAVGASVEVSAAYHTLIMTLAAAHSRLGRACELGCALADTCRVSGPLTCAELKHRFGDRLTPVQAALSDLASSLPDHASRAVSLSLAQWHKWTVDASPDATVPDELDEILKRQGELWRSVLSGEKLGRDMLADDDYLDASKTLLRTFIRRPWLWSVIVAAVVLIAIGLYLIFTAPAGLKAISGAALTVLSALGLTVASIKRSATDVGNRLLAEVWSAEEDWAIAQAVTINPPGLIITLHKREVRPRGPSRAPVRRLPADGDRPPPATSH
ncbi:MAG TPA: hypothetical protein VGG87_05350 [Solirubrobacteraceae bacterium]